MYYKTKKMLRIILVIFGVSLVALFLIWLEWVGFDERTMRGMHKLLIMVIIPFLIFIVIILSPLLVFIGLRAWRDVEGGTPSTFSIWLIGILNFISSVIFLCLTPVGTVIRTGRDVWRQYRK